MIDFLWPDRFGRPLNHAVLGTRIVPPFPVGFDAAVFAMGCFWGAERCFWSHEDVYVTAVGYIGGNIPEPGYDAVCRGTTGHVEAVVVVWDPMRLHYRDLLRIFWESHDPTQGSRQGNDVGTQYRSALYGFNWAQLRLAERTRDSYQRALTQAGYPEITTKILPGGAFYFAEPYHQQYLAKNPGGYCGLGGTGVECLLNEDDRALAGSARSE